MAALILSLLVSVTGAQERPNTLRAILRVSGFESAIPLVPARDLDRVLTSSSFGHDSQALVAAVYFENELRGQSLGPLHLLRVTRNGVVRQAEIEPQGSIMSVLVANDRALVETHWTPSAGSVLVLDEQARVAATLEGFNPDWAAEGKVLFTGNMRHFAPVHQSTLYMFEPDSKKTTEVFPGARESDLAAGVRRAILETVKRLPPNAQDFFRRDVYGPVDDFDRSILASRAGIGGRTVALIVSYDSWRLGGGDHELMVGDERARRDRSWPVIALDTVARCARQTNGQWSCRERRLDEAMRDFKISLPASETDWEKRSAAHSAVINAELKRK